MWTPSVLPLERSTATCGPRGRGQPFDTETLLGVDTPKEGRKGSDDHKCPQRQKLCQDRIREPGKKKGCDHPLPSPRPSRPRTTSYITPSGVSPRQANGAGGEDSPRDRGPLFPHRGPGPKQGQGSCHCLRLARAGPLGFRFPALALTHPRNQHTDTITKAATRRQHRGGRTRGPRRGWQSAHLLGRGHGRPSRPMQPGGKRQAGRVGVL